MIQEVKIKNYLSFKDEQILSFEPTADTHYEEDYCIEVAENIKLLKTAIIYGANGSGKSNLLIALSFLRRLITQAQSNKNHAISVMPFMLDNESRNKNTYFSITFFLNQKKYIYDIELNRKVIISENLTYYPSTRPARLYTRTYDSTSESTSIELGTHVKLSKNDSVVLQGNTLNNSTVLATLSKINIATSILNDVLGYFKDTMNARLDPDDDMEGYILKELDVKAEVKEFALNTLNKADFNINNLEIQKENIKVTSEMRKFVEDGPFTDDEKKSILEKDDIERAELFFWHKTSAGDFKLNSQVQSSGTMRFLGLTVLLYDLISQNAITTIDEIETGLHYKLLKKFIESYLSLSKQSSQLIFSTHDVNLLDEKFIRKDSVVFAEKDSSGQTILNRLSSKGLHKNVSVYNAYMQGKIGGVPIIEEI